ncbi:related to transcription initiation factor [Cephalotrichum gorgonifer]|uniref:Related to transcription initiation factor n=1 Tax=Cephalotrichum gorgonifer TaxID=2041049 RepID=A0AAE8MVZ3_9PEZI|nr:related to transcription initiation factor [Cephalotrichum gorgonifer]
MSLETIYVVRHGFRCTWSVNPVTGETTASILSPTGIPADPPLTAHGVDQSKELATHLIALEKPIDAVYSSPYYRCLQTISPFVKRTNDRRRSSSEDGGGALSPLTVRAERGISEFFGTAHFDHPVPADKPLLQRLFPEINEAYQSRVVPCRRGESIEDLYGRVRSAVENIIEQCDAEGHRTVILCTHAAVVIALGRVLTGEFPKTVDVEDFGAFTCGLSKFRRPKPDPELGHGVSEESRGGLATGAMENGCRQAPNGCSVAGGGMQNTGNWVCEANSDCSFLSGGQERGWSFSGDEAFDPGDRILAAGGVGQNLTNGIAAVRSRSRTGSSRL